METLVWSLCQWYSVNHCGSQGKRLYLPRPLLYKSTPTAQTVCLRNLLFFEKKWLLYLTYQTNQIFLKKMKLDAVVKDYGAVKDRSFINKIFIICSGQVKELLLSLKAISTLYFDILAPAVLEWATEDNSWTLIQFGASARIFYKILFHHNYSNGSLLPPHKGETSYSTQLCSKVIKSSPKMFWGCWADPCILSIIMSKIRRESLKSFFTDKSNCLTVITSSFYCKTLFFWV